MLSIKHLQVALGKRVLLHDVNETWPFGSLVAILGPNGIGKSTLLNHVAGIAIDQPAAVLLDGDDVFAMLPLQRARRIASIAQLDEAPLETLVYDRIAHGLYARRVHSHLSSVEEIKLVTQIATAVGVGDLLQRPLYNLSGGQRKKVHIARALVDDLADVYILDEPDASLDAPSRQHILELLKNMANRGKLVVVSLHHRELAERYADLIVELSKYARPSL